MMFITRDYDAEALMHLEVGGLALAIALSPFQIIPVILLLFTARPVPNSSGFLAGWIFGILASTTIFVVIASMIETLDETPAWVYWTKVGFGLLLIAMGALVWVKGRKQTGSPGWMDSIDRLNPVGAFRLGTLLSGANPKVLILAAAAGFMIEASDDGLVGTIGGILVFTGVASATAAVPIVAYMIFGEKTLAPLTKARTWLQVHSTVVLTTVAGIVGTLMLVQGITGLV
jgi:threonine/homoserine/homoserine lactone efflux protein